MKNRIIFWTRLLSWLGVGCGVPIGVFAYKFGLFKTTEVVCDELGNVVTQTNISLNGWGIVSVLLIGSFLSTILKEVADSYTGYSLVKQCYTGFCKTVPYIVALGILYFLKTIIEQAMFCLGVIIICRLISIPLNPLPKWKYEKRNIEDYSTMSEALTNIVKNYVKRGGA
jgi:hypothetical protein